MKNGKFRRIRIGLTVGVITAFLGSAFGLTDLGGYFERSVGLSWLFNVRGELKSPEDVVVIAINGTTGIELEISHLPRDWPRTIHAELVDELTKRGASSIMFDMQFNKKKLAKDDNIFAQSVDKSDRVGLVELITGKRQPIYDDNGKLVSIVWMEGLIQPLPKLKKAAKGLATFTLAKIDSTVHEFWAFKDSQSNAATLPSLALQIHALEYQSQWAYLLAQLEIPEFNLIPKSKEQIGKADDMRKMMRTLRDTFEKKPEQSDKLASLIKSSATKRSNNEQNIIQALYGLYTGNQHRVLNFYGPPGSIKTIPYQTIIKEAKEGLNNSSIDLNGKTVFVGFSDLYDPGHPDRFYTVFTSDDGVDLSGVEIAATAYSNLLTNSTITPLGNIETLAMYLSFGIVIGLISYLLPATYAVPLIISLAIGHYVISQWLFNYNNYWIPLAIPVLLQFPLALFLGLMGQYLLGKEHLEHMSHALSYYLPENVADDLTINHGDPDAFNKVVYGTCFATDMSGFSTISEQLPPDKLAVFLNDYFDNLASSLKKYDVDVTEFRADAIMCAWTTENPIDVKRKPILAALAAADAMGDFKDRNELLKSSLRVGLEIGNFYIGHAGGGGHFVFSIVGDTANTASRIESLNKHLGTQVLSTKNVVEDFNDLLTRPLGGFVFVGKTEALPIVEILALTSEASSEQKILVEQFAEVMSYYHRKEWEEASIGFVNILKDYPSDGPSRFFMERSNSYMSGAPEPEDPKVVLMESK